MTGFWSNPYGTDHFRDAFAYAFKASQQMHHRPPLHGAIDFQRGADGVWRIPSAWTEGNTVHFGVDLAQPGSDRTTYWSFRR